jgi:hypothetical protein
MGHPLLLEMACLATQTALPRQRVFVSHPKQQGFISDGLYYSNSFVHQSELAFLPFGLGMNYPTA